MQRRPIRFRPFSVCAASALLTAVTVGCSGDKPATNPPVQQTAGGPAHALAATDPPPKIPVKDDNALDDGMGNYSTIGDFVSANSGNFVAAQPFPVDAASASSPCDMMISAATGSHNIVRADAGNHEWYVVALITNPNGCASMNFQLLPGQTVAWLVSYRGAAPPNKVRSEGDLVGKTRLVLIDLSTTVPRKKDAALKNSNGDKQHWKLGYCASDHGASTTDNASLMYRAGVCDKVADLDHNPASIASFMRASFAKQHKTMSKVAYLFGDGFDAALWFACGPDCCYAESDD